MDPTGLGFLIFRKLQYLVCALAFDLEVRRALGEAAVVEAGPAAGHDRHTPGLDRDGLRALSEVSKAVKPTDPQQSKDAHCGDEHWQTSVHVLIIGPGRRRAKSNRTLGG